MGIESRVLDRESDGVWATRWHILFGAMTTKRSSFVWRDDELHLGMRVWRFPALPAGAQHFVDLNGFLYSLKAGKQTSYVWLKKHVALLAQWKEIWGICDRDVVRSLKTEVC